MICIGFDKFCFGKYVNHTKLYEYIKSYEYKVNTNFQGEKVPKENASIMAYHC